LIRVPKESRPQPFRAGCKYVPIAAGAVHAGVSQKTIRRRIADGTLTGYRMGPRLIRVDLNELDALLRPIPTAGDAA